MNIYDLNEIYEMLKRNGYVERKIIFQVVFDIDPSGELIVIAVLM